MTDNSDKQFAPQGAEYEHPSLTLDPVIDRDAIVVGRCAHHPGGRTDSLQLLIINWYCGVAERVGHATVEEKTWIEAKGIWKLITLA